MLSISPDPTQRLPRPLPYVFGIMGTNCGEKEAQIHAGSAAYFDVFTFRLEHSIRLRTFLFSDVPTSHFGVIVMYVEAYESETKEWQSELQASGTDLATVTQRFKLVSEFKLPPKLSMAVN